MICPGCGRGEQRKRSGLCKECEDAKEAQAEWRARQTGPVEVRES